MGNFNTVLKLRNIIQEDEIGPGGGYCGVNMLGMIIREFEKNTL